MAKTLYKICVGRRDGISVIKGIANRQTPQAYCSITSDGIFGLSSIPKSVLEQIKFGDNFWNTSIYTDEPSKIEPMKEKLLAYLIGNYTMYKMGTNKELNDMEKVING